MEKKYEKRSTLAEKLKALRKAHGYTQEDVAAAIGLVRAAYAHYESGKRVPSIETVYLLAGLYDVTVDDLLHISIHFDRNVHFDAPKKTQSSEELDGYLDFLNSPSNQVKFKYFSMQEKQLVYFFSKLTAEEQADILEFIKARARRQP